MSRSSEKRSSVHSFLSQPRNLSPQNTFMSLNSFVDSCNPRFCILENARQRVTSYHWMRSLSQIKEAWDFENEDSNNEWTS